jgi:hypothetical protein
MQEGNSSLFSPKLKKQKGKATALLQRLEDAQVRQLLFTKSGACTRAVLLCLHPLLVDTCHRRCARSSPCMLCSYTGAVCIMCFNSLFMQAALAHARAEAMSLSAAGLQQVPHVQFSILCPPILDGESVKMSCCVLSCKLPSEEVQSVNTQNPLMQGSQIHNAANSELLKEKSCSYVVVDRDESNEWWKESKVGDCFVVLPPWSILPSKFRGQSVVLAFVAVPLPNE